LLVAEGRSSQILLLIQRSDLIAEGEPDRSGGKHVLRRGRIRSDLIAEEYIFHQILLLDRIPGRRKYWDGRNAVLRLRVSIEGVDWEGVQVN
jgi:hypothetical protein